MKIWNCLQCDVRCEIELPDNKYPGVCPVLGKNLCDASWHNPPMEKGEHSGRVRREVKPDVEDIPGRMYVPRDKNGSPFTVGDSHPMFMNDDGVSYKLPTSAEAMTYISFDCLGCKEKDEEIERLQSYGVVNEELRARVDEVEKELDTEIKTRNGALHWKQVEIDKLEAEIKKMQCIPQCSVSVTEEGEPLTHVKLDSILAYLKQWEPAKK
jgi:hypothetical protein